VNDHPEQNYRIEATQPVLFGGDVHAPAELDLRPDRPDYVTADGTEVWIERKHQKTRFLSSAGSQVGPLHGNLGPAVAWARAHGWRDPSLPEWFNDGAIAEASGQDPRANPTEPPEGRGSQCQQPGPPPRGRDRLQPGGGLFPPDAPQGEK
jgi:hypothetical protein